MVKKNYVDAEVLENRIRTLAYNFQAPMHFSGNGASYVGNTQDALTALAYQLNLQMQQNMTMAVQHMMLRIADEIKASATPGTECFLCRQVEGQTAPPDTLYGKTNSCGGNCNGCSCG